MKKLLSVFILLLLLPGVDTPLLTFRDTDPITGSSVERDRCPPGTYYNKERDMCLQGRFLTRGEDRPPPTARPW